MKWRKTKEGIIWCPAEKYFYGIKKILYNTFLLIKSKDGLFSYSLKVKDVKTAKQIAELTEL